jgi:hypothetical protein
VDRALRGARRAASAQAAASVLRVDPADGSTGVFRDAPVVLCVSQPIDDGSLGPDVLEVRDLDGPVPGSIALAGAGAVLLWRPGRPLRPDTVHFVVARGLRDVFGHELPPHFSRFVSCGLLFDDLQAEPGTPGTSRV